MHYATAHRSDTTPRTTDRRPMTPVIRAEREATFYAPVRDPGGRERRELWLARSADGLWEYRRREDLPGTPWQVTYLPTGQMREFGTLASGRRATASTLLDDFRRDAHAATFGPHPTVEGARWLAVHMRLAGADEVDAGCACGGLLVQVGPARHAHVDACRACQGDMGRCDDPAGHRFCTVPRPRALPVG